MVEMLNLWEVWFGEGGILFFIYSFLDVGMVK